MNTKIKELLTKLESNNANAQVIQSAIQTEYNKVFEDSKELTKVINNAQQASKYQLNQYGEVQSWYRFAGLTDYVDCKEYFEAWLADTHYLYVDWKNDCLLYNQGESLLIQDDTKHDNGVWLSGKLVINAVEYTVDGEVDDTKRNALIEAYMERTGYFLGVFRVDRYGNVFNLNTQIKD